MIEKERISAGIIKLVWEAFHQIRSCGSNRLEVFYKRLWHKCFPVNHRTPLVAASGVADSHLFRFAFIW